MSPVVVHGFFLKIWKFTMRRFVDYDFRCSPVIKPRVNDNGALFRDGVAPCLGLLFPDKLDGVEGLHFRTMRSILLAKNR